MASRPLDLPRATIKAERWALGPGRPLRVRLMSGIVVCAGLLPPWLFEGYVAFQAVGMQCCCLAA